MNQDENDVMGRYVMSVLINQCYSVTIAVYGKPNIDVALISDILTNLMQIPFQGLGWNVSKLGINGAMEKPGLFNDLGDLAGLLA